MNNLYCYIHIPFCENKCKYCRFASFGITQNKKIETYTKYLINEIKKSLILSKSNKDWNKQKNELKSIYFGGGTPSILNLDQLSKIISNLKQKFFFDNNIEITLESTPNQISLKKIIGWQKLGINRISIGVQTLNEKSLKEIGRGEKGEIFDSLDIIKDYENNNFNISLDFIIGLPYVKVGEIKKNIELILDKYDFITSISVYMLEDHYYPKKWKELGIKEEDFLGEYISIKKFLKEKGFFSYEISNFAKTGYECKHNRAYWNHSEVLAFGLGAHSFINNNRYENYDDFEGYYNSRIKNIEELNINDIFLEKVMFGLRTTGLKKEIYQKLDKEKINYFINNKYLKIENNILKIEDKGVLVIDTIIKEIL